MKRNIKLIIIIFMVLLLPTGCNIFKNSKTIDYSILMIQRRGTNGRPLDESIIDQYKDKGIVVENYEDDEYVGYKLTIKDISIKDASLDEKTMCAIDIDNLNKEDLKCFERKRGFLKDTYVAKISGIESANIFNKNNNILSLNQIADYEQIQDKNDTLKMKIKYIDGREETISIEEFNRIIGDSNIGYDSNVKVVVDLPYKAIETNASNKTNNDKTLEWDLSNREIRHNSDYEFTFKYPNSLRKVLLVIAIILIIYLLLSITYNLINNKKKSN